MMTTKTKTGLVSRYCTLYSIGCIKQMINSSAQKKKKKYDCSLKATVPNTLAMYLIILVFFSSKTDKIC